MNHTIYEKRKGVEAYGSKTWAISDKEKIWLYVVSTVGFLIIATVIVVAFLDIPMFYKTTIFIAGVLLFLAIIGIFVTIVVLKHHNEDPIEMHYYDVDSAKNYITGGGYDNTTEISKERFDAELALKKRDKL